VIHVFTTVPQKRVHSKG